MPDRPASFWPRDRVALSCVRAVAMAKQAVRHGTPLRWSISTLCLAILLAWTGPAYATTVAILWPSRPSPDVTQALTLLRGELLSVGVEVTAFDRTAAHDVGGADRGAWLEPFAARGIGAVIDPIIDPLEDDELEAVDVWVARPRPQRFEVTHVAVESGAPRRPEMLALRAVEALRAGLLQIDWAARKRRDDSPPKPPMHVLPASEMPAPPTPHELLGLEAGAVAIMSLDGLGPAVLPTVRLGWALRPWLLVQASAAGWGSRSAVSATEGSARVAQQYALLGGCYRLHPDRRLWPFLGLAAGVLHTSIEGQPGWGTGGHSEDRWSGLLDVGLGAGLRLYGRTYLTLAAHAQIAEPYVAIHIVDTVAATSGRPNLLVTLTLGAWL
jgi:hypothetical protein